MTSSLWLASASQRRTTWLQNRFPELNLEARPLLDHSERMASGVSVKEQVEGICRSKVDAALAVWPEQDEGLVVMVADTLVSDPDDALLSLGQPADELSALAMLMRLSGRRHAVWSATALFSCSDQYRPQAEDSGEELLLAPGFSGRIWVERALVEIEELSEDVLETLLQSASWKGKAGGYDLAGAMAEHAHLVAGDEVVVLGLAMAAIEALENHLSG